MQVSCVCVSAHISLFPLGACCKQSIQKPGVLVSLGIWLNISQAGEGKS